MTRHWQEISVPRPRPWTWVDSALVVIGAGAAVAAFAILLLLLFLAAAPTRAIAHENWINKGGFKNGAGEWCCGDHDCKTYTRTSSTASGWIIDGELVPFDEAMPVAPPDGKLTICRRPDGTRRCVFGLRPSW